MHTMIRQTRLQWIVFGLVASLVGIDPQPQRHPHSLWSSFQPPTNGIDHQRQSSAKRPFQPPVNQYTRQGGDNCAINIPGRNGDLACVTYEAVNAAFSATKLRMNLPGPKGRSMTDIDVDHLSQILVETSRNLIKEYNLHPDAVHEALPLIDTQRTVIDDFCPAYLKRPKCSVKRYREYNGMCNNLDHPHWGATLSTMRRLLPPDYADGISEPRISVTGKELPTARYVSAINHRDFGFHDHAVTVYLPAWGQLIDHDMTMGAESKDPETDAEPKCCDKKPNQRHSACWPVEIPSEDPFYSNFGRRCMEFVRSGSGLTENCKLGSRTTMNIITSTLDANFVYGSSKETADKLRRFQGGLLKTNSANHHLGLKDLLPPKLESPDAGCVRPNKDVYCFLAGDTRANQQVMLTTHHTIMMREHNRIAVEFGYINPHWDDEKIYQETRHIVAAMVQHITYNEFLPMVLGKDIMSRYGLLLDKKGMGSFYDPTVDPTIPVGFFAAAYRFGHSLIPSTIERWSVSHQFVSARRLSEMLLNPIDMYGPGICDQYLSGFMNQVSQAVDDSVTEELTNHLFQEGQNRWGLDLASLNMQRGRDNGVPSYNAFRRYCGLPPARHWDDLIGVFTNDTLQRYTNIYSTPDDIDLWSAGISERPAPGSMVGPVFGCIIGETFRNLRYGDRFWYENGGWPSSFTQAQLQEIRKVKLSRLVCDNGDHIDSAQVYVMVLPDPKLNPRVPCRSSILPRINLELWRDSGNNANYDGEHSTGIEEPATVSIHPHETEQLFQVPPAFQHLQEEALLFDEPKYPPDPNHHIRPPSSPQQDYVEPPHHQHHHPEPIHHHSAGPAYQPDQQYQQRPQQYHPPPKASHPPPVPAIFPVSGTGGVLLLPGPPGHHGHHGHHHGHNYGPPPAGYNHVRRPPRTRVKSNILGKLLKLKG
ncbi:peroxidase-like isoform X2 [Daphnia pulicaria]|uniref:peroxidase-like isoform X2 n=1 Tax=Daphnia pulicaria TaxID=35523 RepID=UPI001EEA5FAB|nr:peroxidase-like isoform X2 [Daphnia pulicaria]